VCNIKSSIGLSLSLQVISLHKRPSKVREMARMFDANQRDGKQSSSSGDYAIKVKSLRERRTLQDVTNLSSTNEEEGVEFIC
jgi:hypothetical protein